MFTNLNTDIIEYEVPSLENEVGVLCRQLQASGISVQSLNRKLGFNVSLALEVRRYINEKRVDNLHCHQYTPHLYGALAALFSRTRVVYTEHGRFHSDTYSWKRRLAIPFTAISVATKNALVQTEWFPGRFIRVIFNGLTGIHPDGQPPALAKELGILHASIVFGTIARLDSIKIQHILLNAFDRFYRLHPNTRLLLIGDDTERVRLDRQAARLNISDVIHFAESQNPVDPYLNLIDIFLHPSPREGTSITLLEAMSCRKPSVITEAM